MPEEVNFRPFLPASRNMEEQLSVQDGSNDRKYFTIIPNYVLDHSTANTQALYLQLKRLAGENGLAYPASRYLRGKLGISYNTLKKELGNLIKKGWIVEVGKKEIKTDGGRQKVKSYKIVDIWYINNGYFQRSIKQGTPTKRGVKKVVQGVSNGIVKIGTKEERREEDYLEEPHTGEQVASVDNYTELLADCAVELKGGTRERYLDAASELLRLCENNFYKAKEVLLKVSTWANERGLEWEVETCVKKYLEFND